MPAQRGQVDRLAGLGGEVLAQRPRLLDHVEAGAGRAGEAQQAHAEAVLAASLDLLDEAVLLERGDQPERRTLVHRERRRDLGDAALAGAREDLEDGQGPVDRLDPGGGLDGSVAHGATVDLRTQRGKDADAGEVRDEVRRVSAAHRAR